MRNCCSTALDYTLHNVVMYYMHTCEWNPWICQYYMYIIMYSITSPYSTYIDRPELRSILLYSECVLLEWNVIHALNLMSHLTDLAAILAAARLISSHNCNEWMNEWYEYIVYTYVHMYVSSIVCRGSSQAVAIIRLSAVRWYVEWRQTE